MNLKNKRILITGATGGIGNCLVEKFNNLGSNIFATGTNDLKLNNLKKNLQIQILKNSNQMSTVKQKNLLIMLIKNWEEQTSLLTMQA